HWSDELARPNERRRLPSSAASLDSLGKRELYSLPRDYLGKKNSRPGSYVYGCQTGGPASGNARLTRSENPQYGAEPWVRDRDAYSPAFRRCAEGRRRIAVPRPLPDGRTGIDRVRMAADREQPQSQVLHVDTQRASRRAG